MMTYKWRYIDDGPGEASFNMAVDEAIAQHVLAGTVPPTLRFYGWKGHCISLGRFQKRSDIDIEYCKRMMINIVRRPTGGRAILHGEELTYSFCSGISGSDHFRDLSGSYTALSMVFDGAFKRLDIETRVRDKREKGKVLSKASNCFDAVSVGEITLSGQKIIGSAQKRFRNGFLQQGCIPLSIDKDISSSVFGRHGTMPGLLSLTESLDIERLKNAIFHEISSFFSVELKNSELTESEVDLARELQEKKYSSTHWTDQR